MAVKIGLVGTGTVGGGCIDIIKTHKEEFLRHYGIDIELVAVSSLNPEQAAAHGVSKLFIVTVLVVWSTSTVYATPSVRSSAFSTLLPSS